LFSVTGTLFRHRHPERSERSAFHLWLDGIALHKNSP
jgi:hypothetical protein